MLGVETESHLDFVKLLFPASKSGLNEYKKYDVPLRTIFATILIVTGVTMLTIPNGIHGSGFAITTLCFGGLLALGMLTRPVMLGAAIYYCITGALSIRYGSINLSAFCLMFGCLVFAVVGGGKYSCDTIIRSTILRSKHAHKTKSKENFMGYKAFHNVKF